MTGGLYRIRFHVEGEDPVETGIASVISTESGSVTREEGDGSADTRVRDVSEQREKGRERRAAGLLGRSKLGAGKEGAGLQADFPGRGEGFLFFFFF